MAAGTIYTEIDLDSRKFDAAKNRIIYDAKTMAVNVEDAWKILGKTSDTMFDMMRKQASNAFERIKVDSKSSASEIIRAEEAKNAKIKALNEQQFGVQTSFIDSLKSHWMLASAAIVASFYSVSKAFDFIKMGAQVKSIEESFILLSKNAGIAGDQLILKLKEVTNATVDSSDLMRKANRLITEGFSQKQIIQIGDAARVAARLMGTDVSTAYEQVADSIVNLRQRGLKTAGFVVDLNAAYEKQADRLGISVKYLNDYGKQMALAAAVEEKRLEILGKMGPLEESESERIQKLSANWKDLKENISMAALKLIDFFFIEGRSKTLLELFGAKTPKTKLEETPMGYPTESERRFGGGSKYEDLLKKEQDQLKLNLDYGQKILGVGYLTYQDKVKQLEAERQVDIEKAKGLDLSKINEFYSAKAVDLKKQEGDRISEINLKTALLIAQAEHLSDIGQMPDWRESLQEIPKGLMIVNGEIINIKTGLIQTNNVIDEATQRVRNTIVALQGMHYEWERNIGAVQDWRDMLEAPIPKGFMEMGGKLVSIQGKGGISDILELKKQYAELTGSTKDVIEITKQLEDEYIRANNITGERAELIRKLGEEQRAQAIDGLKKYAAEVGDTTKIMAEAMYNLAKGMESSLSSFFQSMFDKTKSWKDKMSDLFKGLADSFIRALSDMVAKWLVSSAIMGQQSGGGGGINWVGLIGSVIGGISSIGGSIGLWNTGPTQLSGPGAQEGGLFTSPTRTWIGEAGPEAVIPLKGGAVPVQFTGEKKDQGGTANIFQIICMDPISWRDFVRRNPEPLFEMISKDARGAGSMRGTIKGVG